MATKPKNNATEANKPAAGAPKTATVTVTGPVAGAGNPDAELKTQKLDPVENATALKLQEMASGGGENINTDNKDSDRDLPQSTGSVTKKNTKVDADEVGAKENKIAHEISGKLVYETAADFQSSLKKDK